MQLFFFVLKLIFVGAAFAFFGPLVGVCVLVISAMGGDK